jgi:ABC-2 type transport system ATP-binding protein
MFAIGVLVLIILGWEIVPIYFAARIGSRKGRSQIGAAILGFFLGWLGVGILLLLSDESIGARQPALGHTPSKSRPGDNAIEIESLVKVYKGAVRALDGIDLVVPAGSVFGLLGPNGAGKTTVVKIATTLSFPTSGTVRVAGFDAVTQAKQVREAIGVVGQTSGVDVNLNGRENLRLQGLIRSIHGRELKQRVEELLEQFGLKDSAKRVARNYSGGMQRRLDIATALVHRPQVLFLDEPTTGLDPEVRTEMWQEIERLTHDEGLTILLTTHYLEEADQLAAKLAILDRGKVMATGSPEKLKAELEGDTVHVELREDAEAGAINAALAGVKGIRHVDHDVKCLRARVEHGATAVPLVLQALEAKGLAVDSVSVSRPSLDDVYMRYTGREFARADEEGARGQRSTEEGKR